MAKKVSQRRIPLFAQPQSDLKNDEDLYYFPECRIAEDSDFTDSTRHKSLQKKKNIVCDDQKMGPLNIKQQHRAGLTEDNNTQNISYSKRSKKRTRSPSPSSVASDQASKKMCFASGKEPHCIEGFSAIAESIEKLIIETREDRLALIKVMRELLCELRKAR
ncbi:hypothetical protein HYPSUDRAFT_59570 [Hypholoma sublateritium FD-334 SS-4]|uniref:Uncharacterized protein n=1 Tax=Hypholoma sublateritium (strain FD-334 SS-4) TaxID=945553 RepID=A0A0D2LTC2_HYPSF|nr:hypothetical protein HYPSUDRAFT_59570 [Hypholoma sublateritium FD-334 SS-4]